MRPSMQALPRLMTRTTVPGNWLLLARKEVRLLAIARIVIHWPDHVNLPVVLTTAHAKSIGKTNHRPRLACPKSVQLERETTVHSREHLRQRSQVKCLNAKRRFDVQRSRAGHKKSTPYWCGMENARKAEQAWSEVQLPCLLTCKIRLGNIDRFSKYL